ncbi:hypothetical protein FDB52_12040 [Clostridium botulinum]|nr:hypothetical protein [Clostridium botulinum]NFN49263.1 hypothetical protein [Clostridium botulinum]
MRLFKFLVISNDLIEKVIKSREILKELYFKKGLKSAEFLTFNKNRKIGLMRVDYPNECYGFTQKNSAYVIVDTDKYEKILKATYDVDGIGGRDWSFRYDTVGTRHTMDDIYSFENEEFSFIKKDKIIEPRTGGIVYICVSYNKKIHLPLQHWIKEDNIVLTKPIKEYDMSYYHVGHTFDYRSEFIEYANKYQQKDIRKRKEPNAGIYRGKRVLGGQFNFSEELDCTCSYEQGTKEKCNECEGVLYIYEEEALIELYNQLISDEYKNLIKIHDKFKSNCD